VGEEAEREDRGKKVSTAGQKKPLKVGEEWDDVLGLQAGVKNRRKKNDSIVGHQLQESEKFLVSQDGKKKKS